MSILTLIQNICIMYCNRPYEIDWNKIFQIEGQEHLDVNIKNLDVEQDINW